MKGSASLKSVLPAFVPDLSYASLATADGETTSLMYVKTLKDEVPEEEKKRIYANLVEYGTQNRQYLSKLEKQRNSHEAFISM